MALKLCFGAKSGFSPRPETNEFRALRDDRITLAWNYVLEAASRYDLEGVAQLVPVAEDGS